MNENVLARTTQARRQPGEDFLPETAVDAVRAPSAQYRYLFDLSRDVQDIARALKSKDEERERRIHYLEELVKDWARVFAKPSAALQAAGVTTERNSPSSVAETLLQAAHAAQTAETNMQLMQDAHAQQCSELRQALVQSQQAATQAHSAELSELRSQRDASLAAERARADAAHQASQEMRSALAVQVAARTDEAVQTAVQGAEAAASKREAVLQDNIDRLTAEWHAAQDDVASLKVSLHQEQTAATAAASEATAAAAQTTADHQAAAAAAALELKRTKAAAAQRMRDVQAHHADMVDTQRVRLLETHALWLARRVSELQVLCDELQRTLVARTQGKNTSFTGSLGVPAVSSSNPPAPPFAATGIHLSRPALQSPSTYHTPLPVAAERAHVATLEGGHGAPSAQSEQGKPNTTYWYTRAAHTPLGSARSPPSEAGEALFRRFARTHEPTASWRRESEQKVATGRR